jgi:murein DD-endopeptidase MepM/ murein hydrolase activator NlpD
LTIVFCLVSLYGIYALVWLPVAAASLADENTRLRRENEIHRQQLDALANRIEAVEDTSRRIAEVSGVEEAIEHGEPMNGAGGPALPLDTIETSTAIDFIARRAASLEQEILTVENILRERSRTPSWMPTVGAITDRFGVRNNPFGSEEVEFHAGLDFAAPSGTAGRRRRNRNRHLRRNSKRLRSSCND